MIKDKLNYVIGGAFFLLLIGVFIFFADPRNTQRVQAGFLGIISPFLKQGSGLERKYVELKKGLLKLEELDALVKKLQVENKELQTTNQILRGVYEENRKLKASLEYRDNPKFQLVPARIIARDPSTWFQRITIDRGKEEDIEPDMPVLTPDGLVGKTTVVSDHSSQVILIADENCRVSAIIEGGALGGPRVQGVLKGERPTGLGMPEIGLGFMSKQANLKPGDRVLTSGVGGVYPSGILVGVVEEFKARELDGYATVKPTVDLANIEDVFIVLGENNK